MTREWIWAGMALAALAGCEVGEGLTENEEMFNDLGGAFNAMDSRVAALPGSGADTPVTGSAVFEGYAAMTLDTARTSQFVGTAEVEVDFGRGEMSGTLEDFVGQIQGGQVREFAGAMRIPDGDPDASGPGRYRADLVGALSGGGDRLEVEGGLFGRFHTDAGQPAGALRGFDDDETAFRLNGRRVEGELGIVAQR